MANRNKTQTRKINWLELVRRVDPKTSAEDPYPVYRFSRGRQFKEPRKYPFAP